MTLFGNGYTRGQVMINGKLLGGVNVLTTDVSSVKAFLLVQVTSYVVTFPGSVYILILYESMV